MKHKGYEDFSKKCTKQDAIELENTVAEIRELAKKGKTSDLKKKMIEFKELMERIENK